MSRDSKQEQAKRKLDVELDRQLEDTFPASDALKITRRRPEIPVTPRQSTDDQACVGVAPPAIHP